MPTLAIAERCTYDPGMTFDDVWTMTVAGSTWTQWGLAIFVAVASNAGLRYAKRVATSRLEAWTARTADLVVDDLLLDIVKRTSSLAVLFVSVWAGTRFLSMPPRWDATVDTAAILTMFVQVGLWGNGALTVALKHYSSARDADGSRRTTLSAFTYLGRIGLFTILGLLALENLGIDVTALLAGIGIASVAIGLALQNVLSDLFASLSIVLDKPFEVGDFIVVGDVVGSVEHVGLRTTRLRSLTGEQLVVANGDLLSSRIRNYRRMTERRVVFGFGVTYDTPTALLRDIPGIVQTLVEAHDGVRFDRAHFKTLGPSSLDFEVVYWMLDANYLRFMDVQQEVNLGLLDALAGKGIEFAFPTQTVHLAHGGTAPVTIAPTQGPTIG